jgi:hypothetical protein
MFSYFIFKPVDILQQKSPVLTAAYFTMFCILLVKKVVYCAEPRSLKKKLVKAITV